MISPEKLYHPQLQWQDETTPNQVRYILVEIRKLLSSHPNVLPDPTRIRFVGFGPTSLNLEIFAYVNITDYGEFLEVAEDLNHRIMDLVARSGAGFAFPYLTLYVEREKWPDEQLVHTAEALRVAHRTIPRASELWVSRKKVDRKRDSPLTSCHFAFDQHIGGVLNNGFCGFKNVLFKNVLIEA